jgi:capsular exopolysaccharide synthesis family protein
MEKIQSAIAKARAARSAAQSSGAGPATVAKETAAPSGAPPAAAPSPPKVEENRPDSSAVAALWSTLPSFAPAPGLLARNHIVTATAGKDAIPFDLMRTRLMQQMRANQWRRVAITSPGPACGKSTIALNLALSLARQSNIRTILAEMDMRRPSLSRMLSLRNSQSFAQVLEGLAPFSTQAIRIGENLGVSTCHAPHPRPAELLQSPATAAALDKIEAEYDPSILIFDLPPMFVSDDAMAVLGRMDCVLIVAAAEATKIKEIDRCEREVASQTNVLGVVLNKCRYMEEEDYGYDYYGG